VVPGPRHVRRLRYRWLDPEDRRTLAVESWSRVVGGSGQRHHITGDGVVLVEEGFV
jgi:hypothetical protein